MPFPRYNERSYCPESELQGEHMGEHQPDPDTASIEVEWDGEHYVIYVDINCKFCGASGCLGKFDETDEVDW